MVQDFVHPQYALKGFSHFGPYRSEKATTSYVRLVLCASAYLNSGFLGLGPNQVSPKGESSKKDGAFRFHKETGLVSVGHVSRI